MAQVVIEIPRLSSTTCAPWRLGAAFCGGRHLGTLDKALDVTRQNLAMGWAMITMVEGISPRKGHQGR